MSSAAPSPRGVTLRGGITPSRIIAAEVCSDMRAGHLLDPSFERRVTSIDSRDRRWTQELLYGMLRCRAWIDAVLADRVKGGLSRLDPDLVDILRLGTYQLLRMGSVPAYAAIAQTVEITKARHGIGASKLANAVLRRIDREREKLNVQIPSDPIEALALQYSHPHWLVVRWVERWGLDETSKLLAANNVEAPMVLRPYGIERDELETRLKNGGVDTFDGGIAQGSIRLGPGVALTEMSAFTEGHFFVQDPAATLVTEYAAIPEGVAAIDLCAAPGGKTFELSRKAARVYSADRSFTRMQRLVSTIERLNARHIFPLVTDARNPALAESDVVLVDVPCTGTGTFRRHPDARWRLKVSDVAVMSATQKAIINEASRLVKVGGLLIYSTCSLEPEENEERIMSFLSDNSNFVLEPPPAGAVPSETLDNGLLRVLPHLQGADGAFAARLRRIQ